MKTIIALLAAVLCASALLACSATPPPRPEKAPYFRDYNDYLEYEGLYRHNSHDDYKDDRGASRGRSTHDGGQRR